MGKSKKDKKDKKDASMFDMIEDMTGIPSEYIWAILAILSILIVVGCLYFFEIWPFAPEDKDTGLFPLEVPPPTPARPNLAAPSPEAQPSPNLKQENVLFPPPPQPTPTDTGAQNSSPPYITPPTIPTDPAFPPKVAGGGVRIFKKR